MPTRILQVVKVRNHNQPATELCALLLTKFRHTTTLEDPPWVAYVPRYF